MSDKSKKILVVEDDRLIRQALVSLLKYHGYEVIEAKDKDEGLKKGQTDKPDLIILDIMLPKRTFGYEVSRELKKGKESQHIPILVLTGGGIIHDREAALLAGADYYMTKPYSNNELLTRISKLLQRSPLLVYTPPEQTCTFLLWLKSHQELNVQVNGVAFADTTIRGLNIELDKYAQQAHDVFGYNRELAQQLGMELYQNSANYPAIAENFGKALKAVSNDPKKLHLRFKSSLNFLGIPFEFLFDKEYLVLQYPIARVIERANSRTQSLSPDFFNVLYKTTEPLKILLIASDTGSMAGVNEEINILKETIAQAFDHKIEVKFTVIPTEQATYQAVSEQLNRSDYHILHYAGQIAYDEQSPEKNGLLLQEKSGETRLLPLDQLKSLWRNSEKLCFVYLSSRGKNTTTKNGQSVHNYLSIAESVIEAGIPTVLGFRWPINGTEAQALAVAFYQALAEHGEIDTALLQARQKVKANDPSTWAWLSPSLIMQE